MEPPSPPHLTLLTPLLPAPLIGDCGEEGGLEFEASLELPNQPLPQNLTKVDFRGNCSICAYLVEQE